MLSVALFPLERLRSNVMINPCEEVLFYFIFKSELCLQPVIDLPKVIFRPVLLLLAPLFIKFVLKHNVLKKGHSYLSDRLTAGEKKTVFRL